MTEPDDKLHWLVRPETIKKLWWGGCLLLALTVLAQFVFGFEGYFGIDGWFGFGAVFGFLSCLAMVLFTKGLGYLLKRPENYYDPVDHDD